MNYSIFDKYLLKDLIVKVVDNRGKTPLTSPVKTDEFCIPLIEINSLSSTNKFPDIALVKKYVNKNTYETWFRSGHPQHGDILVPTVGTIGLVSMMNSKVACIAQNLIGLRLDKNIVTQEYAFYYMRSKTFTKQLFNLDIGGVQPSIKVPHLLNSEIIVPQLSTQKHITEILSSLDDKIELNNKINKNLEELAKTLYKQWFVDFEFPNEDGEPYKSSGGEMVESELGLIPKDWNINKLCYISEIERGLSYKGKHLCESGVPMINLGSIKAKGGYNYDKIKFYNGDYKQKNVVSKGDIIIANTDMTSTRDILGTPIMVPSIYQGDIIFSHHLYALRKLKISRSYLYYYLKSDTFKSIAENYANGTTVLAIAKNDVEQAPVLIPSDRVLKLFSSILDNVIDTVSNNEVQNISLTKTRDELLPKLMSGEIEVPIEE